MIGGLKQGKNKYAININKNVFQFEHGKWAKLKIKNASRVEPRYDHAACQILGYTDVVAIYGGKTENSKLVEDKVWVLDLSRNEENKTKKEYSWQEIQTIGLTPGSRYGHSLLFQK